MNMNQEAWARAEESNMDVVLNESFASECEPVSMLLIGAYIIAIGRDVDCGECLWTIHSSSTGNLLEIGQWVDRQDLALLQGLQTVNRLVYVSRHPSPEGSPQLGR